MKIAVFTAIALLAMVCSAHAARVMLFFTADWCAACQRAKQAVAAARADGVDIRTVDVTGGSEALRQYGVKALPTYIVFEVQGDRGRGDRGREVAHHVGVLDRAGIDRLMEPPQ